MKAETALAVIFLAAIPLNLYVALVVHRIAWAKPREPLLVLLARLVVTLAGLATVLGLAAANSVLFALTGFRVVPVPISTSALIAMLVTASLANVLVLRYLRSKRPAG